jgi:hypothetical protein
MSETKRITSEELLELQKLRDQSDRLVINLGQIQYQRILLDAQEKQLSGDIIALRAIEKELTDKLLEKYGNVNVDIETGTIS